MLFGGTDTQCPIVDLIGKRYYSQFLPFAGGHYAPFHVIFHVWVWDIDDGFGWDGTDQFFAG